MTARPAADGAVSDVVHEARASVGAIRLAVSTVLEVPDDRDLAVDLLRNAEGETLRLASCFAALPALVACLTDRSRLEPIDVTSVLRRASAGARRLGKNVQSRGRRPVWAKARRSTFERALAALMQVVEGDIIASAAGDERGVVVRLETAGTAHAATGAVVRHLLAGIGARSEPSSSGLVFRLPGGSP